ncbi:Adenylate cyclase type 9 [Liparis tanakae]|uniref:adenylate cyclase n=1 Tax=Liparis tanakae TaxID=230148 RepID=A0A4Z2HSZ7_9TELE|nr:Adenylate cyclase type 9 [Liparis tanakae]
MQREVQGPLQSLKSVDVLQGGGRGRSRGLKTYLISGRKVEPHSLCSCSQLGLPELADRRSPTSTVHTPDGAPSACTLPPDSAKDIPNLKCSPAVSAGRSPKALNGLLSPQLEALNNSQTSLCEMLQEKEKKTWSGGTMGMDHSALIPLRSKNFRERSDAHFVDVIKEDSLMKDYFYRPPINKLSLTFLERSLESAYRISYQEEVEIQAPVQTFASPTFSSFLDIMVCCSVFLALSLACFLRPLVSQLSLSPPALILTTAAALLEALALLFAVRMAFYLDSVLNCTRVLMGVISGWLARHFIGAVLVSLPTVAVFAHVACDMRLSIQFTMFICCAVIIAIIQFCNFCQLSYWMRSVLATLVGLALLASLFSSPCGGAKSRFFWSEILSNSSSNSSFILSTSPADPASQELLGPEACVAFFLVLLLIWFLNREFEVSHRLHYHGNVEADQHRIKIQNMRDQADWLLRNIIPIHVAEQLKVTQSYSKNHDNVGVIFASIVNFSEFYEESYEGGKECYRVLNELIGDFDELLRKPAFSNMEKIKTIGATYMAAAGLNAQQCADAPHPHAHLRALFEFTMEMMRVVDDFNKNMLGFGFKLRIGFNHGPLTAGVIGTTKLLYDIWGDTVNIASRMDTTGVECRVQVSEESYCVLSAMDYEFDYRGTVNVKGKGQMKTFLYPKSSDSGPVPQYQLSVSPEIRVQVDGSIGRSPTDEIASMVPTTSAAVGSTTAIAPGAIAGSSTPTGPNHEKQVDSRDRRPSTETSHARRSTSHLEAPSPSANNRQLISLSVQRNAPQSSTTVSQKDIKKDTCDGDSDSNVGELTRL